MHMLVDDKANTYKVTIHCYSLDRPGPATQVYESTSVSWELVLGEQPWMEPMLGCAYDGYLDTLYCTSAYIQGRIYFADIRADTHMESLNDPLLHGVLRLFEADIRDGQCKFTAEFSLRRSQDTRVKIIGFEIIDNAMSTMHNMELVECKA